MKHPQPLDHAADGTGNAQAVTGPDRDVTREGIQAPGDAHDQPGRAPITLFRAATMATKQASP
jgi:hypothetical protein